MIEQLIFVSFFRLNFIELVLLLVGKMFLKLGFFIFVLGVILFKLLEVSKFIFLFDFIQFFQIFGFYKFIVNLYKGIFVLVVFKYDQFRIFGIFSIVDMLYFLVVSFSFNENIFVFVFISLLIFFRFLVIIEGSFFKFEDFF